MRSRDLFIGFACAIRCALGFVDERNGFAYPGYAGPSDLNTPWQIGTFKPLEWYTTLSEYNMTLWQMDPPTLVGVVWSTENNNGASINKTYSWQVQTYNANTGVSSKYMLWVGYEINRTSTSGFASYTFNITDEEVEVASTSTAASTAGTASTATASSTGTASTAISTTSDVPISGTTGESSSDTSSETPASDTNSDDSSLKIGLGVGLGVGIPLAFALGAWFTWRALRRRKTADEIDHTAHLYGAKGGHEQSFSAETKPPPVYESTVEVPRSEVHNDYRPVELSTHRQISEMSA